MGSLGQKRRIKILKLAPMSFRNKKSFSLLGSHFSNYTSEELSVLYNDVFSKGMHGICFSAYEDGQEPGHILERNLVKRRLEILKLHTHWVRSFSCIEGNELIPIEAKKLGMKTLVGAWLGKDKELNRKEISGLIQLAKEGHVDIAAVGNEVLYRGDLSIDELTAYIKEVQDALPDIPVGYVDAYYEFRDHPIICELCDVILANCYPYWEGCHIDYSLIYMKQMYQQALDAGKGKKVIITETGWPSQGGSLDAAVANKENFMQYFINAQKWSEQDNIEMFYFSSFDEPWKVGPEGDVGAYWGLWDKYEKLKF